MSPAVSHSHSIIIIMGKEVTEGRLGAFTASSQLTNKARAERGQRPSTPLRAVPQPDTEVTAVGDISSPRKLVILESICTTDGSCPAQTEVNGTT